MIPFVDLKAQYARHKGRGCRRHSRRSRQLPVHIGERGCGSREGISAVLRRRDAIGVNSGTSALHLALLAAGIGPGDEVITVPFTFVATAAAIHYTGANSVYVDIDPQTFTMDPAKLEAAITSKNASRDSGSSCTAGTADMDAIVEVARWHKR